MDFQNVDELNAFVDEVNSHLCNSDNQKLVAYASSNISPWNSEALQKDNELLLSSVSGSANVYAIFCCPPDSHSYTLRYIGKSTRKLARQRIRNHLIKNHEKTGAKLSKVMVHVNDGGSIKLAWAEIEPESLRNCIEEELIRKHPEANWNRENA
jgi:hypothetical protein